MKTLFLVSMVAICFAPFTRAAEDCLACHDDIMSKPKKHDAVEMGCTTCHADHKRDSDGQPVLDPPPPKENPYHLATQPVQELCFQCHDQIKAKIEKCRNAKPGEESNCGHPFGKWPGNTSGSGAGSTTHPMSGLKDPLRSDKAFDCTSCHNPHSSNRKDLFRYRVEGDAVAYQGVGVHCSRCHGGFKHVPDTDTITQGAVCSVCHYAVAFNTPRITIPNPSGDEGAGLDPIPGITAFNSQLRKQNLNNFKKTLSGKALAEYGNEAAMKTLKQELDGLKVEFGAPKSTSQEYQGQYGIKGIYEVPILVKKGGDTAGKLTFTATMNCSGETKIQRARHEGYHRAPGQAAVISNCTVDDLKRN